MKLSIGADHAGFVLKEKLRERLAAAGHELLDRGAHSADRSDYPDFAIAVAEDVSSGRADRGVLVCSTGVGMSIAANKVAGVRAALAWNPDEVTLTRKHNDANVIALGAKYLDLESAGQMLDIFLKTDFEGGRHEGRVAKIQAAEQRVRNQGEHE